jgi:thiamine-phosphate diphosphorylase / hydroxyethylthiazole kinase
MADELYMCACGDAALATARKLLGPDAIIGVSCSSVEEAHDAAMGGASYLGIGTMFATPTYTDRR